MCALEPSHATQRPILNRAFAFLALARSSSSVSRPRCELLSRFGKTRAQRPMAAVTGP
jgi:hypothetical protein